MAFLSGYKTYITGAITIIGAIGGILTGALPLAEGIQVIVTAVLAMTLRSGVTTEANK